MTELANLPGVRSAAAASALPLEGEAWVDAITPVDAPRSEKDAPTANFRFVSPSYFATLGTPLRQGHAFTNEDLGKNVVVISERTARTLWPAGDAVGKRVNVGQQWAGAEVVGVVADVHTSTLEQAGSLVVYLPSWKYVPLEETLIVRTTGDPNLIVTAARVALQRADPVVPMTGIRTMSDVVSKTVAVRRFESLLLTILAIVTFLSASIGIFGVIAQWVSSRLRDIAIRMALGAQTVDIHRLVLREGLAPVGIGFVAGVGIAIASGRAIESLLFGVQPTDLFTVAVVAAVLGVTGVLACVIPARRATSVGPAVALRLE
jgi:predicted permease